MRPLVIAVALMGVLASVVRAQRTTITLSGFTGAMGTAAVTDFDNGSMTSATAVGYVVSISNPQATTVRTATVSIKASAGTLGGTKPVGDLQWRRNDLGTWNSMTTTNATVQSQSGFSGNGNSFTNSIWLRVLLTWASDPAATYSTTITITLSVTAP